MDILALTIPVALIVISMLGAFVHWPENWGPAVYQGSPLLYGLTAFVWALAVAEERFSFWFWFILCLIPYVRLGAFAVITIWMVVRAVWNEIERLMQVKEQNDA